MGKPSVEYKLLMQTVLQNRCREHVQVTMGLVRLNHLIVLKAPKNNFGWAIVPAHGILDATEMLISGVDNFPFKQVGRDEP